MGPAVRVELGATRFPSSAADSRTACRRLLCTFQRDSGYPSESFAELCSLAAGIETRPRALSLCRWRLSRTVPTCISRIQSDSDSSRIAPALQLDDRPAAVLKVAPQS